MEGGTRGRERGRGWKGGGGEGGEGGEAEEMCFCVWGMSEFVSCVVFVMSR